MYPTQEQVDKWNAWLDSIGNENDELRLYLDYYDKVYNGSCYEYVWEPEYEKVDDYDWVTQHNESTNELCNGTDGDGCPSEYVWTRLALGAETM